MALNRSLFAVITAFAIAVISDVTFLLEKAVVRLRAVVDDVASFARKVFAGPAPLVEPIDLQPQRQIEQADAFQRRVVKRDRPVISAAWRMCPSI